MRDQSDRERHRAFAGLDAGERAIVYLVLANQTVRQIASRLSSDEATVRERLFVVLDKLDVADRCELLTVAHRLGITPAVID